MSHQYRSSDQRAESSHFVETQIHQQKPLWPGNPTCHRQGWTRSKLFSCRTLQRTGGQLGKPLHLWKGRPKHKCSQDFTYCLCGTVIPIGIQDLHQRIDMLLKTKLSYTETKQKKSDGLWLIYWSKVKCSLQVRGESLPQGQKNAMACFPELKCIVKKNGWTFKIIRCASAKVEVIHLSVQRWDHILLTRSCIFNPSSKLQASIYKLSSIWPKQILNLADKE